MNLRLVAAALALTLLVPVAVIRGQGQGAAPPPPPKPPMMPVVEMVTIKGETFRLELAADDAKRRKGLSGRESLDAKLGMLFVYPDAKPRTFWMYDCRFDIDLLYLDAKGRIVAKHEMKAEKPRGPQESEYAYQFRLERYRSRRPAQFVIELKAGTIKRLELKPGELITLDLERLKKMAR